MKTFTTDVGTLRILETLTPGGRERLDDFLRRCDRASYDTSETFFSYDFHRRDVTRMSMERSISGKHPDRILTTIDFVSGARWRRGSLRMPGVVIPDSLKNALKGRMIEELVQGAPLEGYRIRQAVQDGSPSSPGGTKLRIRCDGEEQGIITR